MGDYWRTSGRSRLKARARNGMGARAERRAAVARADFLYEAPPAPGTTKNHPKRPRRASEVGSNGYDPLVARGVIASAAVHNDRPSSGHLHAAPIVTSGGRILRRLGGASMTRPSFSRPPPTPNFVQYKHLDSSLQHHQQEPYFPFAVGHFERENPTHTQPIHSPEYSYHSHQESRLYYDQRMIEQERWEQEQEMRYHQENSFEVNWGAQPPTSVASALARRQSSAGLDRFRSGKRQAAEISLSPPPRHPPISTVTLPPDNWRHVAVDSLSDVGSPGREQRLRDNDSLYNPIMMLPDFSSVNDNSFGLNDNPSGIQTPGAAHLLQDNGQFLYPGQSTMTQFPNDLPSKRGPLQGFDRFRGHSQASQPPIDLSRHSQQPPRRDPLPGIDRFRQNHAEPMELATAKNALNRFTFQHNARAPQQRHFPFPGIGRFRRDQPSADELVNAPNHLSLASPTQTNGAFPPPALQEDTNPPIRNDFFRPDLRNGIPRFQSQPLVDNSMLEESLGRPNPSSELDKGGAIPHVQDFSEAISETFLIDGHAQFREIPKQSLGSDAGLGIPQFQTSEAVPGAVASVAGGIAKFQTRPSPGAPLVPHVSPAEANTTAKGLVGASIYAQEKPSSDATFLMPRPEPAVETARAEVYLLEESKVAAAVGAMQQEPAPLQFQTYRAPSQSNDLPHQPASIRSPTDKSAEKSTQASSPRTRQWKQAPQSASLLRQIPLPATNQPPETPSHGGMLLVEKSENFCSPPTHRSPRFNRNISQMKFFFGEQEVDQEGTPFGSKEPRKLDQDDATQSPSETSENEASRILQERHHNESIWRHPVDTSQDGESRQETPEKMTASISCNVRKRSPKSDDCSGSDDDSWEEIEKELNKRKSLFRG
eukprot:scaffold568_cov160-Amphora_coffeaeformis.AAC.14